MANRLIRLVSAVLPFVLPVGCAAGHPAGLEVSGLNTKFAYGIDMPFADYLEQSRRVVGRVRLDLDKPMRETIIAANTPFELLPNLGDFPKTSEGRYAKGVLLIHGFSESPYHLKHLGEHLREKGFLVRAILLPGHGTVPGDLTEVKYEEWVKATDYGVQAIRPLVDKLYVAGFSAGAALGVHHALVNGEIDGLLLFSPALAINTRLAWFSTYLRYLTDWLVVEDELDFAKYESVSTHGVAQVYKLTGRINELVAKQGLRLKIPVFIALSFDDFTINSRHTMRFFDRHLTNPQSRILVYARDTHAALAGKPRYIWADSSFVDQGGRRILDFAHTSITIPPGDPHYGVNGEYRNCLHYRRASKKRQACLKGDSNLLGERSGGNLKKGIVQRLTYNPLYDLMIDRLDDFLRGTGELRYTDKF